VKQAKGGQKTIEELNRRDSFEVDYQIDPKSESIMVSDNENLHRSQNSKSAKI